MSTSGSTNPSSKSKKSKTLTYGTYPSSSKYNVRFPSATLYSVVVFSKGTEREVAITTGSAGFRSTSNVALILAFL